MFHKQKKRKKIILTSLITIVLVIGIYLSINRSINYIWIEKNIKDLGNTFVNLLIPKVRVNYDDVILGINQELEEENKQLKDMLNLDFYNYKLIHADVIKRDIDWYSEITINKGEKDGIKVDMAVISDQKLIGRVTKTTNGYSIVKLLSSNTNDMKVAVDIKTDTNSYHGIINGYIVEDSTIKIHNINKNSDIKENDKVYTNGLGGIYPSGIYIGTVKRIEYDSLGIEKEVFVDINNSFDKIRYVSVVVWNGVDNLDY